MKSEDLSESTKSRKCEKVGGEAPLFGVWGYVVVMVSKGCGVIKGRNL